MTVYVQGASALAHYRTSSARTDVERCPRAVRTLTGATSSHQAVIDEGIWRLGIGEPTADWPLDVLVRDAGQRSRSKSVRARVWHEDLAPTSFRTVSKNVYVSSPEFVFLQMAKYLDLPRLAALGMELCGTYRRNVVAFIPGTDDIIHVTDYHQQPLTTPKRIRGFLTSMRSAPGCSKALKALEYVLPGSASPMETALCLLLCLPRRLGGYALPKPTLNPPLVLSKAGRSHTIRHQAKPDLYWKAERLDLEYNGGEFHDESSRSTDSMRRKALEHMKVEVIELTRDELYSTSLFHATALRVAKKLGKRIRSEDEGNFRAKRADLRQSLLFEDVASDSDSPNANGLSNANRRPGAWTSVDIGESPISDDASEWAGESFDDGWYTDVEDSFEGWAIEDLRLDDDASPEWDEQMSVGTDEESHIFGAIREDEAD